MARTPRTLARVAMATACLLAAATARADFALYASDPNQNTIYRFDAAGNRTTFATNIDLPSALALDAAGNLYAVSASTGNIEKYSANGVDLGTFVTRSQLRGNYANYLAFDAAGNLYAASYSTGNIEKISAAGVDLGRFATPPGATAAGLAFDAAGSLYTGTFGNGITGRIEKFSATGADLGSVATFASNLFFDGVAIGAGGNLYVSNYVNGTGTFQIDVISPAGGHLATYGPGSGIGGFLTTDAAGNLFSGVGSTISELSPTGKQIGAFNLSAASSVGGIAVMSQAVPEPASLASLAVGILSALGARRAAKLAPRRR